MTRSDYWLVVLEGLAEQAKAIASYEIDALDEAVALYKKYAAITYFNTHQITHCVLRDMEAAERKLWAAGRAPTIHRLRRLFSALDLDDIDMKVRF